MTTIQEVGAKIRSAITRAKASGFTIVPGRIRKDNSCCAIGATVTDLQDTVPLYPEARKRLGINFSESLSITRGFDGAKKDGGDLPEWFGLGQAIRVEVDSGVL